MNYLFQKRRYRWLIPLFDASLHLLPKPRLLASPKRILIFRADGIGDTLLTLPFIETVAQHFPSAELSVCVPESCSDLFQGHPRIHRVLTFEAPWFGKKKKRSLKKFRHYLQLFDFDMAFEPRGDLRHILLLRRARIRQIVGFGVTGGARLLSHAAPYARGVPVAQNHLSLLKPFGVERLLPFSLREGESDHIFQKTLALQYAHSPHPHVAVHPFSSVTSKQWPLSFWKELLLRLSQKIGGTFFLLGSRQDREGMDYIANEKCIKLPGRYSVRELVLFLRQCQLLLAVDSSVAHMAGLAQSPALLIFSGTNDPREYAPSNPKQTLLTHPVPCAPCEKTTCPIPHHPCLTSISVKQVEEKVLQCLSS